MCVRERELRERELRERERERERERIRKKQCIFQGKLDLGSLSMMLDFHDLIKACH